MYTIENLQVLRYIQSGANLYSIVTFVKMFVLNNKITHKLRLLGRKPCQDIQTDFSQLSKIFESVVPMCVNCFCIVTAYVRRLQIE